MAAPNPPTELTIAQVQTGSAASRLSWVHPGSDVDRFEVLRKAASDTLWASHLLAPKSDFAPTVWGSTTPATFTRASVAYKQNGTQVASGAPRYETGKFGQAIMVEEGTTNLLTANQSDVETDTAGFAAHVNSTIARSIEQAWRGAASLAITVTAAGAASAGTVQGATGPAVTPGASYSAQLRSRAATVGRTTRLYARWYDAAGVFISTEAIGPAVTNRTDGWEKIVGTVVAPANAAFLALRYAIEGTPQAGEVHYIDALQVEAKAYATSWQIGGTARAAELIEVPVSAFNRSEFTIEGWVKLDALKNWGWLWFVQTDANNYWDMYVNANGVLIFRVVSGGVGVSRTSANGLLVANTWFHFTATVKGNVARMYINGVKVGADLPIVEPVGTFASPLQLGRVGGANAPNGLFDDVRISNIARSDAEIAAVAASGSPAPVDANATYKLSFDSSLATTSTTNYSLTTASPEQMRWAVRALNAAGEVSV